MEQEVGNAAYVGDDYLLHQLIAVHGNSIIADVGQLLEAHQGTVTLTEILLALEACWGDVNSAHHCLCDVDIAPYRTAARDKARGDDASSDDDGLEVVSVEIGASETTSTASDTSTGAPSTDAEQLVVADARPFSEETPAEVVMADAAFVPVSIEVFSAEELAAEHTVPRDDLRGDDASSDDDGLEVVRVGTGAPGTPSTASDASMYNTPLQKDRTVVAPGDDDCNLGSGTAGATSREVYPRGFDGQRLPGQILGPGHLRKLRGRGSYIHRLCGKISQLVCELASAQGGTAEDAARERLAEARDIHGAQIRALINDAHAASEGAFDKASNEDVRQVLCEMLSLSADAHISPPPKPRTLRKRSRKRAKRQRRCKSNESSEVLSEASDELSATPAEVVSATVPVTNEPTSFEKEALSDAASVPEPIETSFVEDTAVEHTDADSTPEAIETSSSDEHLLTGDSTTKKACIRIVHGGKEATMLLPSENASSLEIAEALAVMFDVGEEEIIGLQTSLLAFDRDAMLLSRDDMLIPLSQMAELVELMLEAESKGFEGVPSFDLVTASSDAALGCIKPEPIDETMPSEDGTSSPANDGASMPELIETSSVEETVATPDRVARRQGISSHARSRWYLGLGAARHGSGWQD